MSLGRRSITVPITYSELREKMDREDVEQFVVLFLRLLVSTHPDATMATIRDKLANVSVAVSL